MSSAPAELAEDAQVNEQMASDADAAISPLPNGAQDQSSTMDHEFTAQTELQTSQHVPHHNRKDASLREFLSKMDDYAPIIPDAVTFHYLTVSGLPPPNPSNPTDPNCTPLPLARLLVLATQKFIADVAADAYQYSRIRASNTVPAATNAPPVVGVGGKKEAQLGVQRSGFGGGGQGGSAQGRTVLTMEDLGCAVAEYGVNVRRGEFYR